MLWAGNVATKNSDEFEADDVIASPVVQQGNSKQPTSLLLTSARDGGACHVRQPYAEARCKMKYEIRRYVGRSMPNLFTSE